LRLDGTESRFLVRSAVADYENGRIEEAKSKLLRVVASADEIEPEVFEYLYLIAQYEEPKDQTAVERWKEQFVAAVKNRAAGGDIKWQLKLATMCEYGDRVPIDHAYTREATRNLAQAGVAEAQYRLAAMYARGRCGVEANELQYVGWLELAATNGFPEAQHEFALLLLSGDPVTDADRAKALELLRHAARAGFKIAESTLLTLTRGVT
jgi:TPR repeat protein